MLEISIFTYIIFGWWGLSKYYISKPFQTINNSKEYANVGKKATKAQTRLIIGVGASIFDQQKSRPDMGVSESATNRKT